MNTLIGTLVFILGACIGSFLNVCIYRLPREMSLWRPRSHCRCGKTIAWYDNVPIISWLILRGRARCCDRWIGMSYPLIELTMGLLSLYCWWYFLSWPMVIVSICFVFIMMGATFVDWDTMTIPDSFSIGGTLLGLILSIAIPMMHVYETGYYFRDALSSFFIAVLGVSLGSGLLIWIAVLSELIFKKEAMGFGDIKLIGCIGAFCGWKGALFSIFAGAAFGLLFIIPVLLFKLSKAKWAKQKGQKFMEMQVPFGPWLSLAAVLYLLLLAEYVDSYIFSCMINLL